MKTRLLMTILMVATVALTACSPTAATSAAPTALPASTSEPADLSPMPVSHVEVQIGVGSPIPVFAFVSADLPDTCAQLAEVKVQQSEFRFDVTLLAEVGAREECFRDTLPFGISVPLNMVSQPDGTYTVVVNGVSAAFGWPSAPTMTPEPSGEAPASGGQQTYRNETLGFELDFPAGWVFEGSGDDVILWSSQPVTLGIGGVPDDIAKIDISSESGSTLTLEELVARQKRGVAEVNGSILSEDALTLSGGLRAVRMSVSAVDDNITMLTVINGRPVVLTGFGDLSRFDEVALTLRPIQ